MNISSVPPSYSISSSDTITITNGGAISGALSYGAGSTVTLNTGAGVGGSTISIGSAGINTINSINPTTFNWQVPMSEWVDSFPDFDRVQKMCRQYPGLKIAYEKFVTTYKLVKDDYDNPTDKK